jgi:sugar/nucleoside kinase (ribokinase family)
MLGAMTALDVLAVGEVMVDVRVPSDALQAGHVLGRVAMRPGGSSATAAAWAAASGATASVVGRIGSDFAGFALREALETRGVEPLLVEDNEAPTGVVLLLGDAIVAERGANARLRAEDLPEPIGSPAVLVSGYLLLHEDTEPTARAALARASGPWIAVDAASARLVERFGPDRFLTATTAATVLLLNEAEARALTGRTGAEAAHALADEYRIVCVKQGGTGAVAIVDGRLEGAGVAEPQPSSAEVTGAGDAFAGALLAELVRGRDAASALAAACAAGAAALRRPDGWPAPRRPSGA